MEPGEFIRPPEAPVFQPTLEEFKDPVAYLTKIRPVVLNTGICKIKPPSVSLIYLLILKRNWVYDKSIIISTPYIKCKCAIHYLLSL